MKEEGRKPSKFPFLPPASPRPHDPGGRVNSARLLLINPWPEHYGVASRAVLGSQEHFREELSPKRRETKQGLSLETESRQQDLLDLLLNLLSWLIPSQSCWQVPKVTPQTSVCCSCPLFVCVHGGSGAMVIIQFIWSLEVASLDNAVFVPAHSFVLWALHF